MRQMLFYIFFCVFVYIPHTSIQDESIPIETHDHHQSRRAIPNTNNVADIENLLMTLTEQQYQYETAYYALALNNVFPNFAKLFHERSEQKYHDIKGLIRICQILNLDINLQRIAPSIFKELRLLLSPHLINQTNFVRFLSKLKINECNTTVNKLNNVYGLKIDMIVPLQMYLKEKFLMKQILTCKLTSDVFVQVDRFNDAKSNDKSIPFSFMFTDSRVKTMLPQ